ncbi:MAG: DUF3883 domain-containing protein [Caldilineaceae bacterium]
MANAHIRTRLETEVIVIGYAMSRLDQQYLIARNCSTWQAAYHEAAMVLEKPPQTFNNLRDEFDPIHPNPRQGWHNRTMRASRLKVVDELQDLDDDALLALVDRILQRDEESIGEAIDSLAVVNRIAHNVAERLLTGRRAEEYFLANVQTILQISSQHLIDLRHTACGYDFGVTDEPDWAIEIKGMKETRGAIQFTDREWREAKVRKSDYWVIVIGNLAYQPVFDVFRNPHRLLTIKSRYRQTVAVDWIATVSLS